MFPICAHVLKNEKENDKVSLLSLSLKMPDALAGQFVMAWLPGHDEKPMSIAETKPSLQLAIARAGPVSTALANLKKGDEIFIRGPFGKPFMPYGKKWLLVGGGYGFAPLRFLARAGIENKKNVQCILGARSRGLLMKIPAKCKTHICTDDGSCGTKGNVLASLEPLLKKEKFDCIYSCGPEKMMHAVAIACKKRHVRCQLSVERYMKCGFGVCGHCAMGCWLSCIDGPTIDGEEALANPEFGKCYVDKAGRKIKV